MILKLLQIILLIFLVSATLGENECDLNCHFDQPYITSETIRKWPNTCTTVCGNIFINENTDLTYTDLKDNFRKLENLKGTLKVQNSNITSLNFFQELRKLGCDEYGLVISNNSYLSDISAIRYIWPEEPCVWHITNNLKLDMSVCNTKDYETTYDQDTDIYGNKKDCECVNIRITPESLPYYTNCTTITGGWNGVLKISNVSDSTDLSGFSKLKEIKGNLEIFHTQLSSLSFLSNLQKIYGDIYYGLNNTIIRDNPNLKRLGWDSLKKVLPTESSFTLYIKNNHPDFCLSLYEAQIFAEAGVVFYNEDKIQLCPDLSRKDRQKVCKFETLGSLDPTCQHVIGNVIVDGNNEKDVWRLENVTNIYGNLGILETAELEDLSFLSNLRQIVQLDEKDVQIIQIRANKKLKTVAFPKMKMPPFPFIDDFQFIEIKENSQKIFKNQKECLQLQARTRTPVKYNGKGCMKLPKAKGGNGGLPEYIGFGGFSEWDYSEGPEEEKKKKGKEKKSCGYLKIFEIFMVILMMILVEF